jgi:hypothetical protein
MLESPARPGGAFGFMIQTTGKKPITYLNFYPKSLQGGKTTSSEFTQHLSAIIKEYSVNDKKPVTTWVGIIVDEIAVYGSNNLHIDIMF